MAVDTTDLIMFAKDMCLVSYVANIKLIAVEVVVFIVNIVLCVLGTVANGMVIVAYCRNHRLRTLRNFIFAALAITDITVNACVQPIYITYDIIRFVHAETCSFALISVTVFTSFVCVVLSLSTILVLTMVNFIALAYPYRYASIVTKYRLKATLLVLWMFVLILLIVSIFVTRKLVHYGIACTAVITMSIVVLTWIWKLKLVRRHRNAIHEAQPSSLREITNRNKIMRSTVTAFLVMSSLFICYLPCVCLFVYFSIGQISMTVGEIWLHTALTMAFANSVFNPFLVFWRCSDFRETAANLC